jgi:hypothetical protein
MHSNRRWNSLSLTEKKKKKKKNLNSITKQKTS